METAKMIAAENDTIPCKTPTEVAQAAYKLAAVLSIEDRTNLFFLIKGFELATDSIPHEYE